MDIDDFPPNPREMEMEMEIDAGIGESNSVGTSSSKRKKSEIWDYFNRINVDGKGKAQCKGCGQIYAISGTTNLNRHIEKLCKSSNPQFRTQNAEFSQEVYRDKLAKAIVRHNQPFTFVEYEGYRDVFSYLNPQVKHICRNTEKADILKIYNIEKEKLKKNLESLRGRICLTSDLWTSIASNGYMTVTAHYVDNNWELQSRVLIFRHVPPPHDGNNIGEKLISFVQEWGIERKVFTLTLDNASYNENVVDILRDHVCLTNSSVCYGKFMHIRCGAHILNLVVQSGLKTIDGAVQKIRDSVKYVRGSDARIMRFVECVKQVGLRTGQTLKQDLPFRWNSTYLMIDSALVYKSAFLRLNLFDTNYRWCPNFEEWERVEKIAKFLQPFYEMTVLFSGTKYPTANLYFPNVWNIQKLIMEEIGSPDPVIKKMAMEMKPKFDKYWESYSTVLSFAIVLDPRYKLIFVEFAYKKLLGPKIAEQKVRDLKNEMQEMLDEYLHASASTSAASGGDIGMHYDPLDEFDIFQSQRGVKRNQSQLDSYIEDISVDRRTNANLNVLEYWRGNLSKYPELALMARDVLSIPITSVASESVFSHGGRILGKFRSSLLPKNAEALVCARDWLEVPYCEDEEVEELSLDIENLVLRNTSASTTSSSHLDPENEMA